MQQYYLKDLSDLQIRQLCARKLLFAKQLQQTVSNIEQNILKSGDAYLQKLSLDLDGYELSQFAVSQAEIAAAGALISEGLKQSIIAASQNIKKFHQQQLLSTKSSTIEINPGINCWREFRAINSVGLYVPGGSAPLFSSLLMMAIPAQIAGCNNIIVCTPAKQGKIDPHILWTADLLNIKQVYKVGGAQAVFAMAYGTKQIPKVNKIFGPGNQYVSFAKQLVAGHTAIDLIAGPSELLAVINEQSKPSFVAADLLAQAEHGPDSQVVVVSTKAQLLTEVQSEIQKQLPLLERRQIIKESLANSLAIIADNQSQAIDFINLYAPEHLLLAFEDYQPYLAKINNAGSIFCGDYASESLGDYASGTNHILPTSSQATSHAGLSVNDFGKWISCQHITKQGLQQLAPIVQQMARAEQLTGHSRCLEVRLAEK